MAISQGFFEGTVRYARSFLQVLVEVGDDDLVEPAGFTLLSMSALI